MTLANAIEATQRPDWLNPLLATLHARSKDSPGKLWWNSAPAHDAVFRALKIERGEYGAFYAALPFRLARIDGRPQILAALPCPHFLLDGDDDWLRIETVLAWDPVTDTATVMGDPSPDHLIGALASDIDTATVFGSPFAFFRAIAEIRAAFFGAYWRIAGDWKRKPAERDETPGLLLIGDVAKVRWPIHTMPESITCQGIDARSLNRAMIRQARVPHASLARQNFRNAA